MSRVFPRSRARYRRRGGPVRRMLDLALAVGILGLLAVVTAREFSGPAETISGIARISDGDSLVIGERRIRLHGIDAPEFEQLCTRGGNEWPCGREARNALARLAGGGELVCEGRGLDRYGRMLARCERAGLDIAGGMVEQGLAVAYGDYHMAEAEARQARRGLWAGSFDEPQDWRRVHGGLAEDAHGGLVAWLRGIWHGWSDRTDGDKEE